MTDTTTLLHDQRMVVASAIQLVDFFQTLVPPPPSRIDWVGRASERYLCLLAVLTGAMQHAGDHLSAATAELDAAIANEVGCGRE